VPADFNNAWTTRSRGEGRIPLTRPTLNMTSTKIDWSFNKIAKLADSADLAEMLFPGNRNKQHAFLVLWIAIKWSEHNIVPNFTEVARENGVSRRTVERVRAKLRRLGVIDHVSRFNAQHGYREGWVLSTRFQRSLAQLAAKAAELADSERGSREKDEMLLDFARVRREIHKNAEAIPTDNQNEQGDEQ
jgi:hypothetical protein